jgi:cytidylate kinase
MYTRPSLEKYLTYINSEWSRGPGDTETPPKAAITISRQSGSGGHVIAEKVAELLQTRLTKHPNPWLIFDRNLAEKVLEDNNLPKYFAKYMPEDKISAIAETLDEMFGLHPPFWTLMQKTSETILRLARQGNVILIGRGANIITREVGNVFHVRLVGSLEKRVEHMREIQNISRKEALELIYREDHGRQRYLKKHFGKQIDDPSLYHLIINTDLVTYDQAAQMVAEGVFGLVSRESAKLEAASELSRTAFAR